MIAELYAKLGGAELWNRARLARYMSNGIRPPKANLACAPCEGLEDLAPALAGEAPLTLGYQLPELDPAPWYDAAVPESKDFAGLLVLETVLSPALDRRMVQNVGDGGTLTRARRAGRVLTVRGFLVGRTCCAAGYGLRWLTRALSGAMCDGGCEGCVGCSLIFLTCAPSDVDESECLMVYEAGGAHVPYFRPDEGSEWTRGLDFARVMHRAGVLRDPQVISQRGGGSCQRGCGCGSLMEVEFAIGLGTPWLNLLEEPVAEGVVLGGCSTDLCAVQFEDGPGCDKIGGDCAPPSECADDPDCLPGAPPAGQLPEQDCGCVPLVIGRNCFSIPQARNWFDQVLVVEVAAGSAPLRNLAVRAWRNPLGLDCCAAENQPAFPDCDAYATLLVGYVPAGGVLRFDSAARNVTVACDGETWSAAGNVSTVHGMPFDWLEVGCDGACVTIDIDCVNTAADATASVYRVGREQ